ncbi:MAG: hypothetical protein ACI8R4_003889 [Paracoccaceae bacterium]|jgi:preprotein translocase subunit SecD
MPFDITPPQKKKLKNAGEKIEKIKAQIKENGATAAMNAALAVWKKEIINEITKFKNRDGRAK